MTTTDTKTIVRGSRSSELRIGVLCVNMDSMSRDILDEMVAQTPGAYVVDNVEGHISPREVMKMLEPCQHRICIVDFDGGTTEAGRIAERLRDGCDNSVAIFAASRESGTEQILAAMRAGCSEYLMKPFEPERVAGALAHDAAKRHSMADGQAKGRLVTVMGAKGGTGATSLALHLALCMVQTHQKKCLLVDAHPAQGDASLYLALKRHQYSFYELVHNTDRLDEDLLRGFVLQHSSGLAVLDSPETMETFPHTSPDAIEHTLAFLAEIYQFVIIDCPPGMSENTCAAIRQSDQLAIVITPELPAIRNAIRSIEYLTSMHFPEENIDVVLNRYSKKSGLSEVEIESALHRPIALKIPNNYSAMVNAINAGAPLEFGRQSDLSLAFDTWANRLLGRAPVEPGELPRRWFSLFGG